MRNNFSLRVSSPLVIFLAGIFIAATLFAGSQKKDYYVYQYVIQKAEGSFDEISRELVNSAKENGWQVLAQVDNGVPKKCPYKARVFVLYDSAYAEKIMEANSKTGPFAVVDRINLFQDENGTHISLVNPHSINRTILMNDTAYEKMSEEHLQALRKMITGSVKGTVSDKGYGQKRSKGYIGKTMGIMAGGSFDGKIKDGIEVNGSDLEKVVSVVNTALMQAGPKWGTHEVYKVDFPKYKTVLFGVTGTPMDSKSFEIVRAGSDNSRKHFKCPGLAHAAAYPLEVVVVKENSKIRVTLVDEMFRMKMYFEDAGKWAFMKNMGMPGSIQDELLHKMRVALKLQGLKVL